MSRPERQSFAFMPSQQPKSSSPPRPAGSTPPWREQPEQPVTVPTSAMQATMLQSRFDNLDTSSAAASVGPAATVPHLLLGATDGATMLQPGQPLPKQKKKARRPLAQQPPVLRTALRAASGGADAMRELQEANRKLATELQKTWTLATRESAQLREALMAREAELRGEQESLAAASWHLERERVAAAEAEARRQAERQQQQAAVEAAHAAAVELAQMRERVRLADADVERARAYADEAVAKARAEAAAAREALASEASRARQQFDAELELFRAKAAAEQARANADAEATASRMRERIEAQAAEAATLSSKLVAEHRRVDDLLAAAARSDGERAALAGKVTTLEGISRGRADRVAQLTRELESEQEGAARLRAALSAQEARIRSLEADLSTSHAETLEARRQAQQEHDAGAAASRELLAQRQLVAERESALASRDTELAMARMDVRKLGAALSERDAQLAESAAALRAAEASVGESRRHAADAADRHAAALADVQRMADARGAELVRVSEAADQLRSEASRLRLRCEDQEARLDRAEKELTITLVEATKRRDAVAALEGELQTTRSRLIEAEAALRDADRAAGARDDELRRLAASAAASSERSLRFEGQLAEATVRLKALEAEKRQLRDQLNTNAVTIETLQAEHRSQLLALSSDSEKKAAAVAQMVAALQEEEAGRVRAQQETRMAQARVAEAHGEALALRTALEDAASAKRMAVDASDAARLAVQQLRQKAARYRDAGPLGPRVGSAGAVAAAVGARPGQDLRETVRQELSAMKVGGAASARGGGSGV